MRMAFEAWGIEPNNTRRDYLEILTAPASTNAYHRKKPLDVLGVDAIWSAQSRRVVGEGSGARTTARARGFTRENQYGSGFAL
jgi:hypothetical protein